MGDFGMRLSRLVVGLVLALLSGLLLTLATAPAQAAPDTRRCVIDSGMLVSDVRVVVSTPKGVPATTSIKGCPERVVASDGTRRKVKAEFRLLLGRHRVAAPDVVHRGRIYIADVSKRNFTVVRGKTSIVRINYFRPRTAPSRLRVTDLAKGSVSLSWRDKPSSVVRLRRTAGTQPATSPRQGEAVRVLTRQRDGDPGAVGSGAVDRTVKPGRQYTYALFARHGDRWIGPITLNLATPARTATRIPRI